MNGYIDEKLQKLVRAGMALVVPVYELRLGTSCIVGYEVQLTGLGRNRQDSITVKANEDSLLKEADTIISSTVAK